MRLGEKLRQLRKQVHKMTLLEVSEKTGLSVSFISDIERERTNPSLETIEKLASCYDVSIHQIIPDTKTDKQKPLPKGFQKAVDRLNIPREMQEIMLLVEHRSQGNKQYQTPEEWIQLYYSLKSIMD